MKDLIKDKLKLLMLALLVAGVVFYFGISALDYYFATYRINFDLGNQKEISWIELQFCVQEEVNDQPVSDDRVGEEDKHGLQKWFITVCVHNEIIYRPVKSELIHRKFKAEQDGLYKVKVKFEDDSIIKGQIHLIKNGGGSYKIRITDNGVVIPEPF